MWTYDENDERHRNKRPIINPYGLAIVAAPFRSGLHWFYTDHCTGCGELASECTCEEEEGEEFV
jgi:hypothetical protein